MEKVTLTKEQAKAIETQLKIEPKSDIVWARLAPHVTYYSEAAEINKIDPDTLIRALYIGYEVDLTPTEQAIHWCIKTDCIARGKSAHDVVMAIKHILEKGATA